MNQNTIKKYAGFLVKNAVNLQPGQTLIINCPTQRADFARLCAAAAWEAGARDVAVHFNDEQLARLRMEHGGEEALADVKPWRLRSYMDYAEGEGGAAVLSIIGRNPDIYKGLDSGKVSRAEIAAERAMQPWRQLTMGNRLQWCVAAAPVDGWTARLFPQLPPEEAETRLWQLISRACRMDAPDPAAAWQAHVDKSRVVVEKLNGLALEALHFSAKNGTDLRVGLAQDHVWAGVQEETVAGVPFLANVPTEEVFTAPHNERTSGVVKSSLPYVYAGNLIEDITLEFEAGRVVRHSAGRGEAFLQELLDTDDGAKRLGEIALVPASSPIRQSGVLFYNTLFDENAACHMALGAGYPSTVAGGDGMDKAALAAHGLNDSLVHEDIMIGTPDMNVDGILPGGESVAVFRDGEWAL